MGILNDGGKMKVYIAGKVSGLSDREVFEKFYKSAEKLKGQGHTVMSPSVLLLNKGFEHSEYMHICFSMIDVCDAVYMQKDWQKSKGAKMELEYATRNRKTIIHEEDFGSR